MLTVCERLAGEMEICRNEDTAEVFKDLADRENTQIDMICEQAEIAGAKVDIDVDDVWFEQDLRGPLAREIADNPYLMTPYRAFQLAVINKERLFEIFSTLAASQDDDVIRLHAETLARAHLSEIAALRLRRRRASRSEIKTAIDRAGLGTPPIEMEQFDKIVRRVHAIIRTMTFVVRDSWSSEMTRETETVFQDLLDDFHDFPDELLAKDDRTELEIRITDGNDTLFAALKSLLRELESAVDLFLVYADTASSEDVVLSAQTKAERYVQRIAKIRDELNLIAVI